MPGIDIGFGSSEDNPLRVAQTGKWRSDRGKTKVWRISSSDIDRRFQVQGITHFQEKQASRHSGSISNRDLRG